MNSKNMTALLLTGVLTVSLAGTASAARPMHPLISSHPDAPVIAPSPAPAMADSELYYGEIKGIEKREDGSLRALWMTSQRSGDMVMNLTPKTAFVDSSAHTALDPATLTEGQRVYIYHSPMVTRSLPPQTAAFAVVANLPMDVGCGRYQEVEALHQDNGILTITSDNCAISLLVDDATELRHYDGSDAAVADLREGSFVMAWYEGSGAAHVDHLLLLPCEEAPITRAQLAQALHKSQGSPIVNYLLPFTDVEEGTEAAEAIRWAASEQIMSGYTATDFGAEDEVTLEQAVTALWRMANSPRLMDYPGLTQYSDAGDISPYARFPMLWAHQQGLLDRSAAELQPQKSLTASEANALIAAFQNR